MKRNAWKWALLGGALTFIVLYGIEMSTAGIERINGPFASVDTPAPTERKTDAYTSETDRKIAALEKELDEIRKLAYYQYQTRLPGVPYENDQPPINKLADSTSGLLQSASSNGIRFVVSLFEGLMK